MHFGVKILTQIDLYQTSQRFEVQVRQLLHSLGNKNTQMKTACLVGVESNVKMFFHTVLDIWNMF